MAIVSSKTSTRDALEEDLEILSMLNSEVQDSHHKIFPQKFKPSPQANMESFFADLVADQNVVVKLAFYDEQPAGYIVFKNKTYPETVSTYEYKSVFIEHIAVLSDFQSLGLGKMLMEQAVSFAKEQDIKRVELDVWSENTEAKKFFKALGFCTYNENMFLNV